MISHLVEVNGAHKKSYKNIISGSVVEKACAIGSQSLCFSQKYANSWGKNQLSLVLCTNMLARISCSSTKALTFTFFDEGYCSLFAVVVVFSV